MSKFVTETIRRVTEDDSGEYISVGFSPDFPENGIIYTEGKSMEYFGPIRIDIHFEMLRQMGQAMLDTADDIEEFSRLG